MYWLPHAPVPTTDVFFPLILNNTFLARIRDLSNGGSVSVPPPSPGPSCKLAQFRYGKEEMLALFVKNIKPPSVNKDVGDVILKKEACNPLAMMPLTEEEQVRLLTILTNRNG